MRVPKKILICAGFLPVIVFLSFAAARAQTAVSYQFLEVVDSQGKPVAEAAVETFGYKQTFKTDERGRVEKLPIYYGDFNTRGFTVSKTGYYPVRYEFGAGYAPENPIRLVLLKIPQTDAEREIIEAEQRRREFFAAARAGDVELVRKFLKAGLSANLSTSDLRGVPEEKDVPIIVFAARSGDSRTVNEFLAAGVKVGRIPGILITYLSAHPFTRFYPNREAEKRELLRAFEEMAEGLIDAGADVRALGSNGETALMIAAGKGYVRTAKLLVEKGVPVNAANRSGETALIRAIIYLENSKARIEMADLLLRSGADVNLVTEDYVYCQSPLMSAAWGRADAETVKFLLANGADVNVSCKNGETVLKLLEKRRAYDQSGEIREIIKMLEAAGAK